MNKSEKRNFLGSLKNSKRRDSFTKLFNSLNSADKYEAKSIRTQFESLEAKVYKELKYRLQEKILSYLATYDLRSGPQLRVKQLKEKGLVLAKRGFLKEAIVNYEKARELAERYEYFSELFQIYPALTRYYLYYVSDFQSIKKGLAIVKIWSAYASAYDKNQKYRVDAALEYKTYLEAQALITKNKDEEKENYIVTKPQRFTERLVIAEINLFKAINSDSKKKILQANKQSLKIYEDFPHFKDANIVSYTTTLINAISQSIGINRYRHLNDYKNSLESLRYSGTLEVVEGRLLKYYGIMVILLVQSDYSSFRDVEDAYRMDSLIHDSQPDISMILLNQSLIAYSAFSQADYDRCWKELIVWLQMEGEKHAALDEIIYTKCILAISQLESNEPEQCKRTLQTMIHRDLSRLDNKRMYRFISLLKKTIEELLKADKYRASIAYSELQSKFVYNSFEDYLLADWLERKIKLPADTENKIQKSREKGFRS